MSTRAKAHSNSAKESRNNYGISENVQFKKYNVKKVFEKERLKYHITGTYGLLDYFHDEEAVEFFRTLSQVLIPGGSLIASNMARHDDRLARRMMRFFGDWKLIYWVFFIF